MATDNTVTGESAGTAQTDPGPDVANGPSEREIARTYGWWREHKWPVSGALALLLFGMIYSFFWYPVVRHIQYWVTPSDIWSTFRDAHYVIWSGEGAVYNANTNFVTFPGIAVFLAPFAWLQDALKLSASSPGIFLAKPMSWYLLGPVDLLCGGFLLFPLDLLARRLSLSSPRRALATLLETALIFPAVAFWGHPEDTLAIGLGIYALLAAYDRRWLHSAAFFALAVVFQPLTLLIVPLALAYVPARKWPTFGVVMAIPSAALLIAPLVKDWGPTTYAIFKQPNDPGVDHPTPWLSFAPILRPAGWATVSKLHYIKGTDRVTYGPVRIWAGEIVAAGPGRTIALALACLVGVWVARRKPVLVEVIWWAALALSLRCVFESVIDPYYLVPSLVLVIVAGSTVGKVRFVLILVAAAICTRASYWHTGEWRYYLIVIGSLLAAVALSWPGHASRDRREAGDRSSESLPSMN
jgi:hypothetical protein